MLKRSSKKIDFNELPKEKVEKATSEEPEAVEEPVDDGKDPNAVALGRKGGKKGGKKRAENMTPEQRSEAARKAAQARWAKKDSKE